MTDSINPSLMTTPDEKYLLSAGKVDDQLNINVNVLAKIVEN